MYKQGFIIQAPLVILLIVHVNVMGDIESYPSRLASVNISNAGQSILNSWIQSRLAIDVAL